MVSGYFTRGWWRRHRAVCPLCWLVFRGWTWRSAVLARDVHVTCCRFDPRFPLRRSGGAWG